MLSFYIIFIIFSLLSFSFFFSHHPRSQTHLHWSVNLSLYDTEGKEEENLYTNALMVKICRSNNESNVKNVA